MGDLRQAVSGLDGMDRALIASGECQWNRSAVMPHGVTVEMYNSSLLQVIVPYACSLQVAGTQVLKVRLTSSWLVKILPADDHLDFRAE